jgi:hypothetical protein
LLFGRLEAPLFVPARARCTRRAEIGSRRAAGLRAAAHSGLDAIEHGARLRSGRASSLPDHGSFRGLAAQRDADSRNMAIRKAGAPDVPGAVTAVMRAAVMKAEPPSLVSAGTPSHPSAGGTVGSASTRGQPGTVKVAIVLPQRMVPAAVLTATGCRHAAENDLLVLIAADLGKHHLERSNLITSDRPHMAAIDGERDGLRCVAAAGADFVRVSRSNDSGY